MSTPAPEELKLALGETWASLTLGLGIVPRGFDFTRPRDPVRSYVSLLHSSKRPDSFEHNLTLPQPGEWWGANNNTRPLTSKVVIRSSTWE